MGTHQENFHRNNQRQTIDLDNYGRDKALQVIIRSLGWTELYKKQMRVFYVWSKLPH